MLEGGNTQLSYLAIRPLVVSTEPCPGECLLSVLARACEANIFTKPSNLLNLIGLRAQASEAVPFTHTSVAGPLAKLLGTTPQEIESRMHPAVQDEFDRSTTINWFGTSVERWYLESRVRRFAPHSLEQFNYFPAIWAVRLLDYCPTTMELLVSDCPSCCRPLGWRACRFLTKCDKCGASLLNAQSSTLPPPIHEHARLGAALVSPTATVRQAALSSLPHPFRTWAPADALVGITTLGEAQLSLPISKDSSTRGGAAAKIAAGLEFVRGWPDSLSRYTKMSMARSDTISIRSGLGPLGKLFEGSTKKTPIRDLVRSSISVSLGEAVVPTRIFAGGIVSGACRDGMITTLEASKKLGIGRRELRKLEGRSETFLARHNAKGGTALYDDAAISNLRDALSQTVRGDACARQLGIPRYCVEAFTSAGMVKFFQHRDAEIVSGGHLISKKSIDDLRQRLRERSRTVKGSITLCEAMRRNGDPQDWVAVFLKMLSGGIPFQSAGSDSIPLCDALFVQVTDVACCVSRRTSGPDINGINISCQTAAEINGTTQQFISAAVKIGFLDGKVGVRNSALPLESVLTFQKKFVFNVEICETFGWHPQSVFSQLSKLGLKPAARIYRTSVWLVT
jgi:hypothetical protein